MPSTAQDSLSEPELPELGPNPTNVFPTIGPERSTSMLHETSPETELTVKLTCSAGIPWLAYCGLYGSRAALTDMTFTGRYPEEAETALGVGVQAARHAPTIRRYCQEMPRTNHRE
jgi:hypothetical protein